jgi:hypothetical protein
VGFEKALPGRQPPPIRRRLDAVSPEDVRDRRVRNAVPQIRQRPLNPVITPGRTLLGYVSSVARGFTSVWGKVCRYSRLRLG